MKKFFFLSLLFFTSVLIQAQSQQIKDEVDSLLNKSFRFTQINVDSAISFSLQARELAQKENYRFGYINSFTRLSIAQRFKGLYDLAIEKADSAILLSNGKHPTIEASAYNNIGVAYRAKGEPDHALSNFLKAIDIYTTQKDTVSKATVLNSVGVMFMYSDIPKKAIQYYQQAEGLQQLMGNKKGLADVYNNFAIVYANAGDLDSSLLFFQRSLNIEKELGNDRGVVESYGNIALVYFMQGKIDQAIEMTEDVINLEREAGNIQGEIASYNSIAEMLMEAGETERALDYLQKALKTAKKIDSHTEIATSYLNMAECYQKLGKLDLAIENYINYSNQQDSAKSLALQQTITELEAKYQNKEKEQLIKIQDLTIQEKESSIQAKTNQNIALIIGIIAIIILAIFLYYSYKSKKNQEMSKAIIKEQEKGMVAVFNAQEEERKRISKDLHDGVGQQLSGLKMGFQKVAKSIKDENPQRSDEIEKLSQVLSDSADEVRSISHQMMPKALTELGLIEALEDMLSKSLGIANVDYEFEHFGIESRLDEQVEISLYRVVQELVNNILKHSEATKVNVQLFKNQQKTILIVEDNGKGFELNEKQGHGLLNMKSRINSIQGEINIEPSPSKGTVTTIRITA